MAEKKQKFIGYSPTTDNLHEQIKNLSRQLEDCQRNHEKEIEELVKKYEIKIQSVRREGQIEVAKIVRQNRILIDEILNCHQSSIKDWEKSYELDTKNNIPTTVASPPPQSPTQTLPSALVGKFQGLNRSTKGLVTVGIAIIRIGFGHWKSHCWDFINWAWPRLLKFSFSVTETIRSKGNYMETAGKISSIANNLNLHSMEDFLPSLEILIKSYTPFLIDCVPMLLQVAQNL